MRIGILRTGLVVLATFTAGLTVRASDLVPLHESLMASPALAASTDWSGFYFGASLHGTTSNNFDAANSNMGIGLQAGYLHQEGIFVLGGEAQFSLNDKIYHQLDLDAGVTQSWSAAAKLRAGVSLGDVLIYGTGGLSVSQFRASGPVIVGQEYNLGATIGAGAEYFVTDTVSLRAEYLQTHYADFRSSVAGTSRSDQLTTRSVSFGVSNHF